MLCSDQPGSRLRRRRDPDTGVVCMGDWQGQQVLGMRLTSEQTLYHAGAYRYRAGSGI